MKASWCIRFSVAFWHAFRNGCGDQFGAPTRWMPWDDGTNSVDNAQRRVRAAFEFFEKLGVGFYCFHDRDVAPEGRNLRHTYVVPDSETKTWRVQQMLVDPDDNNDWVAEFEVDLAKSRETAEPVLRLVRLASLA